VIRFADDDFAVRERDTLYYVRALEEARPAILGNPLRPERDASGEVVSVSICVPGDDCLDEVQERAWSSPIFVDFGGAASAAEPSHADAQLDRASSSIGETS
jgi:hypothetical protein